MFKNPLFRLQLQNKGGGGIRNENIEDTLKNNPPLLDFDDPRGGGSKILFQIDPRFLIDVVKIQNILSNFYSLNEYW